MFHPKCEKFINSSIGQLLVVDEVKLFDEAVEFCKYHKGILLSLNNQEIVDEISEKLENCDFNINNGKCRCIHAMWHTGLVCKNGIYKWIDGRLFNKSVYRIDIGSINPFNICQKVLLDTYQKKLSFKYFYSTQPFLCEGVDRLEDEKVESKGIETNKIIILVSVCLVLFLVVCFLCFVKRYRSRQNQKRRDAIPFQLVEYHRVPTTDVEDDESVRLIRTKSD